VQGQRVMTLVDGGATYNFIDVSLFDQRKIHAKDFERFNVVVAKGLKYDVHSEDQVTLGK